MSFLPVVNSHHGLAALLGFNSDTNIYNYCYPEDEQRFLWWNFADGSTEVIIEPILNSDAEVSVGA